MSPRSRTFWRAEPPFRRKRRGARAFVPAPRSRPLGVSGFLRPRPARVLLACSGFCARAPLVSSRSSWRTGWGRTLTRLPSHAGPSCFAWAVSGFRRCGGGAAVVVFVRARVRFPVRLQVGSQCIGAGNGALGQAICLPRCGLACPIVWFRALVLLQVGPQCIGVGNGALGQAIYLPQCGLTCPIVWFRALVLLQVGSQCIGVGNGALGQAICLPQCGLACPIAWFRAPVRLAGVRFRSDTSAFTVIPRSASVMPLAK